MALMTSCRACGAMISADAGTCPRGRPILSRAAVAPAGVVALLAIRGFVRSLTALLVNAEGNTSSPESVDVASKFGRDTMQNGARCPRDRGAGACGKGRRQPGHCLSPGKGGEAASAYGHRDPRSASGRGRGIPAG